MSDDLPESERNPFDKHFTSLPPPITREAWDHYISLETPMSGEVTEDAAGLSIAAGWCAPSETVYDMLFTDPVMRRIAVSRGGVRFEYVEPTPSQIAAREALQSWVSRVTERILAMQDEALDNAAMAALRLGGFDVHVYPRPAYLDEGRALSPPYRFIGIALEPKERKITVPTIVWHSAPDFDEDDDW